MTELDRPIKHLLREPYVAVDALWQRIEVTRRAEARGVRRGVGRGVGHWQLRYFGFAAAIGAVFGFALLAVTYTAPRVQRAWLERESMQPLSRANGEPLRELDTTASGAALEVNLSDGSSLQLEPGTHLVTRHLEARHVQLALTRGSVVFDVKPHGLRRWLIDAGDTQVEVLGTRFRVEYIAGRATVAVQRGRVKVRGSRVPQGACVLGAGERIVVVPPLAAANPSAREVRDTSDAVQPSRGARGAQTGPGTVPPSRAAPATRYDARHALAKSETPPPIASADPGAAKAAVPPITATVLLQRADAARLHGEYTTAARALSQFLSAYPNDTRAPLVALTLGRMQLDHLGAARAAAASLALAERLGLPEAVAEAGAARLVEAYAKSGERELAVAAAARYRRRFPTGPRSASVAAWIDFD